MTGFRLGVDFGTSTTIAMLGRPEGRVQPLLFDGSPLLSSAVLLGPDGRLHTGRDAAHLARSAPERLEPNPKRRVDDTSVLLGDAEVGVRDLVAAVLERVATEARRVVGPVSAVTLTHPANWGAGRRAVLVDAARQAGFADVGLVGEPVAAATYLAATRGAALPVGACVVVYDLGAGTCDVTVLRRAAHGGFEPVASDGLNDVGGLDVDATVVAFLEATYGTLWTSPATRRQLWDDVRSAKEMLSRASGTVVMIPALGKEVPLGREQLEGLARPVLRQTVSMTRSLLTEAGVPPSAVAGLFLVGGSSRIPLVATMLHEALGIAPVVAEQPELVVAEGALYATGTPSAAAPVSGTPASGPAYGAPAPQSPFTPAAGSHAPGFPSGAPVSGTPFSGPSMSGPPMSGPPMSGPPMSGGPSIYDTGAYTGGMPASAIPESTAGGGTRPAPVSAAPYASAPTSATPGGPPSAMRGPLPPVQGRPGGPGALGALGAVGAPGVPRGVQPGLPGVAWPPPARQRSRGAGVAVAVVAVVVAVLVLGAGVGAYLLLNNNKGGNGGGSTAAGATPKAGTPGKYQLAKIPQNICGTIDAGAVSQAYEEPVGDPSPTRNLSTYVGTASCSVTRMHKAGTTVTTATVSSIVYVYADLAAGAAFGKQLLDSARLNGTVTDVKGIGEQAFVYHDNQQPTVLTLTLVVLDSNLTDMLTLIVSADGSGKFTDAQLGNLQGRLVEVGKATFPKAVAAVTG